MNKNIINDNKFFDLLKIMNENKRLQKEKLKDKIINGNLNYDDLDALMNLVGAFDEVMSFHSGHSIYQKIESQKIVKQIIDISYNDIIDIFNENASLTFSTYEEQQKEKKLCDKFIKEVFCFLNARQSLVNIWEKIAGRDKKDKKKKNIANKDKQDEKKEFSFIPSNYDTEIKKHSDNILYREIRNLFDHACIKNAIQHYQFDFNGNHNFSFLIKIDGEFYDELIKRKVDFIKDKQELNLIDLIKEAYFSICKAYDLYNEALDKDKPKEYEDYISIMNKKKAHDISLFNNVLIAQFKSKKDLLKYACLYMTKEKVKKIIKIKDKKIQADTIISIIDKNKTFDDNFINKIYTLFGVS